MSKQIGSGTKWRQLTSSRTERSLLEHSRSRSKSGKYTPMRSRQASDLHKNIKALNDSKLDTSRVESVQKDYDRRDRDRDRDRDSVDKQKQQNYKMFQSVDKNQKMSPRSEDSFNNDLKRRLKNYPSISESANNCPQNILMQLHKIQKNGENHEHLPIFSLDQEHRHIHDQLNRIKKQFVRFKQQIQTQLSRQNTYMKRVVSQIQQQFSKIVSQYCHQQVQWKASLNNFQQIQSRTDLMKVQIGELSPQLSEIHKVDISIGESRVDLNKILSDEQGRKTDKSVFERVNNLRESRKNSEEKLDRSYKQKSEYQFYRPPKRVETSKNASKREFQKLFEAVDCLKKDIKDLKNLSHSTIHQTNNSPVKTQSTELKPTHQAKGKIQDLLNMRKSSLLLSKNNN